MTDMTDEVHKSIMKWYHDTMAPPDYGWAYDELYTSFSDGDFEYFVGCSCVDCDNYDGPEKIKEWRP